MPLQYYGGEQFYRFVKERRRGYITKRDGDILQNANMLCAWNLEYACEKLQGARAAEAARLSELARESHVQRIAAERERRQSTQQVCCLCHVPLSLSQKDANR